MVWTQQLNQKIEAPFVFLLTYIPGKRFLLVFSWRGVPMETDFLAHDQNFVVCMFKEMYTDIVGTVETVVVYEVCNLWDEVPNVQNTMQYVSVS